jgi:hypothetical protein
VPVTGGTVSVSFDLPRFGISLVTLARSNESEREVSPRGGSGCSCRLHGAGRTPLLALLALSLAVAVGRQKGKRVRSMARKPP